MQTSQAGRAGRTALTNYELGVTVKMDSQDYEFCRRTGFKGLRDSYGLQ